MNFIRLLTLGIIVANGFAAESTATVEGRVQLPKAESAPVVTERYGIVSANGVMATNPPLAVVYLEGNFPRPATPPIVQLIQKDMAFIPALLPVQIGTRVEFPNLDKIYHNVYSYSRPKRFDLGRYQPNEQPVPAQLFEQPGLVTVRCEIHEHMRGLILVLATPYFAVTDPDGRFRLSGLPHGRYVLKAWINSETIREVPIELTAGGLTRVDLP